MSAIAYRTAVIDGKIIFYREAGPEDAPARHCQSQSA